MALTNTKVANTSPSMITRLVGDEGAISTFNNGATMASLNADAPANSAFPFTGTEEEHTTAVEDYFVSLGLPKEQILSAHVNTSFRGSGPASEMAHPHPTFVAFSTVLARAINGVLVPDSVAWARQNDNRQFVAMTVYWPTIADAVVNDATTLAAVVADPSGRANYLGKLPPGVPEGRVVIHHTGMATTSASTVISVACYDVPAAASGETYFRHFDKNGTEFQLPDEQVAPPPQGVKPSK